MWFWWFMFISDLLISVIMLIFGRMMWKHCPKRINSVIGYRTTRSMKNMDTWKFAHDYCGRLWWKMGLIMLVPSVLIHIPFYQSNEKTIGIIGGDSDNNSMYSFNRVNFSNRVCIETDI